MARGGRAPRAPRAPVLFVAQGVLREGPAGAEGQQGSGLQHRPRLQEQQEALGAARGPQADPRCRPS